MPTKISSYISDHITENTLPDIALASFDYDGVKVSLIPSEMERVGDKSFALDLDRLRVTLELNTYPDDNAAEWVVRFRNNSDKNSGRISELCGMDITLPSNGDLHYGSLIGDLCGSQAFTPYTEPVYQGTGITRTAVNGRSSAQNVFPYFDLCEDGDSSLICAIGWTGKWRSDIARVNGVLTMCASIADANFYLYPNEIARSPRILLMSGDMSAEDIRRRFVDLERRCYSPRKDIRDPNFSSLLTFQCFDRYYWNDPTWPGEEKQMYTAEKLIEVGNANGYWLDAAWFDGYFLRGVGNYRYNEHLPNGMMPITDKLHKHGIKSLLWFEPESVQNPVASEPAYGKTTDFFREHPEWLLQKDDIEKEKSPLFIVNMGIPEAREYLLDKISKIIKENKLDFFRQDFNQEPVVYWQHTDTPDRRGITEIHYIEGLYAFWDALRKRFPNIVIDNCSSGGRRLDFEMLSRSVSFWRSDTCCGPATEQYPKDIWDQNMTMGLSRYIPYHAGGLWFDDLYSARSTATRGVVLQMPLLDDDYDCANARIIFDEILRTRHYFDGDFYCLTEPTLDFTVWAAYQLHLEEADAGMVKAFRRKDSTDSAMTFKLRGLKPDKTYTLTMYDEHNNITTAAATGEALATGYVFSIPEARASLLVEYK